MGSRLQYVPLLKMQRDLHDIPRGMERFQEYISAVLNADQTDAELMPLVWMNPMGKEHVAARLDDLLGLDADAIGLQAVEGIELDKPFRVGMVVCDDVAGGWTNRYTNDFTSRFEAQASLKREWLTAVWWVSEEPTVETVREAVLMPVYRAEYLSSHGEARTLSEMLAQEGYAMGRAGCTSPALDAEDLEYTRAVLAPLMGASDRPTVMACLYGDEGARAIGYPPQGLSAWAGLALALSESRAIVPPSG